MKIKFANGKEIEHLDALETEEFWGGSNRRTLTFTCERDAVSVDELSGILSDSKNTASLTLTNEEMGTSNVYEGYTLKLKVGIEQVIQAADSPENPEQRVERLIFKLGKPTYIETQLAKLGLM